MTPEQLALAVGCPIARARSWVEPLEAAMASNDINTPQRRAAFLAQIGHESGRLVHVRELWGPTPDQVRYERNFAAAWPPTQGDRINAKAFALGNAFAGDGLRYRGRGLIQVTGRANYQAMGKALDEDLESRPELLETTVFAAMSAAIFWQSHGLNELADAAHFDGITKRINGGFNGHAERVALWHQAQAALEIEA